MRTLARELLEIEAAGDSARARRLLDRYGKATLEIDYGPSSFSSTEPFRIRLYEQGGSQVHDAGPSCWSRPID